MKKKKDKKRAAPRRALPIIILAAAMGATCALFLFLARAFLYAELFAAPFDRISGVVSAAGAQMGVMLAGAAILFVICAAEGIAFAVIWERVERAKGEGGGRAVPPWIIAALCAFFTALFFFGTMGV